jgi:hypothetical protein
MRSYICHFIYQTHVRMKTLVVFCAAALMVLSLGGCYTLNLSATPSDHAISMSNMPQGKIIKHFTLSKTIHHLIEGLVTLNDAEMAKDIEAEVKSAGGKHAVNVKVKYQMTFVNGLINSITFGIYNPMDLTVEGDVVE